MGNIVPMAMHHKTWHGSLAATQLVQGVNYNPPGLDRCPLPALVVCSGEEHKAEYKDPLHSHQLPVVMLWLSCA